MRCVDPSCSNTLLGGLFLHATHKPSTRSTIDVDPSTTVLLPLGRDQECKSSRFSSLVSGCDNLVGTFAVSSSTLAMMKDKPRPMGTDPVFNPNSPLFIPNLEPSGYYNQSSPLDVNPLTHLPYAIFHEPVPYRPDGYPILVSEYISQRRATDTYSFLLDGNYLDPHFTSQLTIEMVTYGKDSRVFGYFSAVVDWLDKGDIKMTYSIVGLPITIDSSASQITFTVVLIALVCLYIVLAIHDTFSAWSIEKKSRWRTEEFKVSVENKGQRVDAETEDFKGRSLFTRQELRAKGVHLNSREKRLRAGGESQITRCL